MSSPTRRNLQLDVLRGLAILLVIGRHLELDRPAGAVGALAGFWYKIGWLGVDLFFVLSGFLIGGLLISELHTHGRISISRFLIRRGFKIYPLYYLFIGYVIFMPAAKALVAGRDLGDTLRQLWSAYWPNLLFLQNYIGPNPAGHTWTLAVEEHFYLILPFLLAGLAAARRIRWLIPLCVLLVPVFLGIRWLSIWLGDPYALKMAATHLRIEALLFGVGVRAFAEYHPDRFERLRAWRLWLFAFGLACWLPNVFLDARSLPIRTVGLTGTLLGSAAFLVAALHTHATDFGRARVMVRRGAGIIGWIGLYSYSIYLWHVTTMGILERIVGARIISWAGGMTSSAWLLSAFSVTLGAIVSGAIISRTLEWPVLRVRDRFFPSRSGPAGAFGQGPVPDTPSQRVSTDSRAMMRASP